MTATPLGVADGEYYWHKLTPATWRRDEERFLFAQWQFSRLSARLLHYLHGRLRLGENGQDEITVCTHAARGGFSVADFSRVLCSKWDWDPLSSDAVTQDWLRASRDGGGSAEVQLFHPVKDA